jgi:hypothetical protein
MSGDEDPNKQNWSGTFVRNRTEVVSVAILIFVTTELGLNFKKIPILGIDLAHDAPKGIFLIGMFGFFLYFLACWCVRCMVELKGTGLPKDYLASSLDPLTAELAKVREVSLPNWQERLPPLEEQWSLEMKQFWEQSGMGPIDLANWFNLSAVSRGLEKTKALETFEARLPEYEARIVQAQARLQETGRRVTEMGVERLHAFRIDTISELTKVGPEIGKRLDDIHLQIELLRVRLKHFRHALAWDKIVLGFWVPLVVAVLLVFISSPQAWLDTKQSVRALPGCFTDWKSCFLREDVTTTSEDNLGQSSRPSLP